MLDDVVPVAGRNEQVGLLLAMLDATTAEWRYELGDISQEQLLQQSSKGHSIGTLILHIADVEAYWLHQVATGYTRTAEEKARLLSQETDQYGGVWPAPPVQPVEWFFAQLETIRARTKELLASAESLEQVASRGEDTFTLRWLLHHVIIHEAYHGGQAVLLSLPDRY